jgi:hypothetical protein
VPLRASRISPKVASGERRRRTRRHVVVSYRTSIGARDR